MYYDRVSSGTDRGLVSVVMGCYNAEPGHLVEALDSALSQSYGRVEVVVTDDGSTREDTIAVLDEYRDRVHVLRQMNRGVASARNAAIHAASGQYILPLDSDDYLSRNFVAVMVRQLEERPGIAAATSAYEKFGNETGRYVPPAEVHAADLASRCLMWNSSMFRRADWERLGGYDESLRVGFEDWEWWLRLLLQTQSSAQRVDGVHLNYRRSSLSRNDLNYKGVEAHIATRRAMLSNNPDHADVIARGMLTDLSLVYEQGQNQSPIADAATAQARYWAQRYGKLEGAINLLQRLMRGPSRSP